MRRKDLTALTEREREIVSLAALGRANKVIGYELGLAESTVATHLKSASAKLGVRSRNGLLQAYAVIARDHIDVLTESEREVVMLALGGKSNSEIAAVRGTSARTVANQLASSYKKLGISSRRELIARSARQLAE